MTTILGELQRIDSNVQHLVNVLSGQAPVATLANQQLELADLKAILAEIGSTGEATSVQICVTSYTPLKGGLTMAGNITMTDDHVAHTPIKWADDVGPVAPPADAMVVSSDPTVATMAFNTTTTDVDTTPLKDGTVTMTVSSASLSITDSATVVIGAPVASSVTVDAADTTFTPKGP